MKELIISIILVVTFGVLFCLGILQAIVIDTNKDIQECQIGDR